MNYEIYCGPRRCVRALEPGEMPRKIGEYCRRTGQEPPRTPGEVTRTILESLALRYRQVLESLEDLLNRRFEQIHIVGGGSRNAVLNQFVADCTARAVFTGPSEATAAGNILVQALGSGAIASLQEARQIVRQSLPVDTVTPSPRADWDHAYERFRALRV